MASSSSSSFVPKGQQGLLLRTPLTIGFAPTTYDLASSLPAKQAQTPMNEGTPKKVGFYTRNNPHPGRVRHIKGLLDFPICSVEDNSPEMRLLSPPSGRDFGPPYRPSGGTRYGSNRAKGIPAVGVVPVTYAWRNELESKAHQAISRAMGQPPPSRRGIMSRGGSRMQPQGGAQFDHLQDDHILELLCKILQTDSVSTCQAWLASASETEKNIVLNMIRMAATGEIDANPPSTRPQTHESQYRYVWSPEQSNMRKARARRSDPTQYFSDEETEFDFSYGESFKEQYPDEEHSDTTAFKFPEHDTVIQTARQLANLASRQSSRGQRTRSFDMSEAKTYGFLSEAGHQMQARPLSQRLSSAHSQSRPQHSRSTSLSALSQMSTGSARHVRARSKSATDPHTQGNKSKYPPPPVRVSVTKEKLRDGSASGKARLRYTSHWET